MCRTNSFERKLHADDRPLVIQQEWCSPGDYSFVLMKRPPGTPRAGRDFPLRRSVSVTVQTFPGGRLAAEHQSDGTERLSVLFVRAL